MALNKDSYSIVFLEPICIRFKDKFRVVSNKVFVIIEMNHLQRSFQVDFFKSFSHENFFFCKFRLFLYDRFFYHFDLRLLFYLRRRRGRSYLFYYRSAPAGGKSGENHEESQRKNNYFFHFISFKYFFSLPICSEEPFLSLSYNFIPVNALYVNITMIFYESHLCKSKKRMKSRTLYFMLQERIPQIILS